MVASPNNIAAVQRASTLPAEVLKVSAEIPQSNILQYAASLIARGQVVGIPTDTFYGLAADPFNLAAVEQIYRIKGRPENRALPILVSSVEQASLLARQIPESFLKLARKFWPGALTLVVEASHRIPLKVTGNTGRVALRWPNSHLACRLIDTIGIPVTGTSANLSGFPACTSAGQLMKQLGERLKLILDSGETGAVLASTIVDVGDTEWHVVREGALPIDEIAKALEE